MVRFIPYFIYFLLVNQLFSQQNAIYSIIIDYHYDKWEGCELCHTESTNYGRYGLDDGNGSPIFNLYTTQANSVDIAFWEVWNYNTYNSNLKYCWSEISYVSALDEFLNQQIIYCDARRNVETATITLGNTVEYGNANSVNLGSTNAGSYVKTWMLPYESEGDIISVNYCENIFEREGIQVEDGFWEYFVDGNLDWVPINDVNYQSLYPLNISVEELDEIIPEDLQSLGNIQLKFTLFANGSGSYLSFLGNETIIPGYEEKDFFYFVEFSSCSIGLDPDVPQNPQPIPVECYNGSDGGVTVVFERELEEEETITINLTLDTNEDEDFNEDPIFATNPLTASDFNGATYTIENQFESGNYQMEWALSNNNNETVWSEPVEFNIPEPLPITFALNKTDPTCTSNSDGGITVANLSGGNGNYTFDWEKNGEPFDLPEGSTNTHLINLPEGSYSLLVTDILGCESEIQEVELSALAESPQLDTYQVFQPGTPPNYLPTGSIIINNIIGGSGNYILHWEKDGVDFQPQDPYNLNELESGSYDLTIEDADTGCLTEVEPPIEDIVELDPLSVVITETLQISCEGDVGILEANPSGGTNGGYEYLWSTGETTQSIQVGQGEYSVMVTDNGDSQVQEVYMFNYVNPLLTVEANMVNVVCKGEATGTIYLDISGGTGGPYTVSWLDTQDDGPVRNDLEAGEYIYFVTDGECQVTNENEPIIIDEPEFFFTVEKVSQTNVSLNGENDGSLEITLDNGSPPYTFNWTKDEQPYEPTAESTDTNLVGLEEGIYQVVVTDDLGCQATLETPIQISEPDPLAIVEINTMDVNCKGDFTGSITANVTGIAPFNYTWTKQGDVSFSAPNHKTIEGLSSGTYILSLSDNSVTPELSEVIVISEPDQELTAKAIPNITECFLGNEGSIQISAFGGTPPYRYSISNGIDFQENPVYEALESGTYQVMVKDKNQCEYQTSVILGLPEQTNAEFAMSSQVLTGETVLAVDLSYPIPDELEWVVPDEAIVLNKNSDELEMVFSQPGEYEVGILAYRGDCLSTETKKVLVLEGEEITQEALEDDIAKKIESFIIYPNPTTGRFNVYIQLGEPSNVSLKIFGLASNNLIRQEQAFGQDEYEIPMDISGLPSGLYVIVLETQFGSSIQKIILI